MIRTYFMAAVLFLALCIAGPAGAKNSDSPQTLASAPTLAEANGDVWMNSSTEEKLAFLLGVENAIAMECALDEQAAKDGLFPMHTSPFQKGWMIAFTGAPHNGIVTSVDAFYAANPNAKDRHVFDVIWTELVAPRLSKK